MVLSLKEKESNKVSIANIGDDKKRPKRMKTSQSLPERIDRLSLLVSMTCYLTFNILYFIYYSSDEKNFGIH